MRSSSQAGPLFVAEVSSNHHRDLDRCLRFIDVAADIGCGAVKFQLFRVAELFAPEILARSEMHRKREAWELPVSFLPALARRCAQKGVLFSCTPFYVMAVEQLLPFVAFYKIASYELLWDHLLQSCAATGKPIVLSTGMATMPEIEHAVEVLRNAGCRDLTLLHCISGYPTPVNQCNLAAIETLRHAFNPHTPTPPHPHTVRIGWSDHSVSPEVLRRAVQHWNASMIEFHLDLDGSGDEFKTGHCWLPEQIRPVIEECESVGVWGYGGVAPVSSHSHSPILPHPHSPILPHSHSPTLPHPDTLPMDGSGIKEPAPAELPDRAWRADPQDGLRPLRAVREQWLAAPSASGRPA